MKTIINKTGGLLIILFLYSGIIYAQKTVAEQKMQDRAKQKVGLFCEYITTIADKQETLQDRLHFCDKALSLFIGRGDSYEDNGVFRKGVMMQVSSATRKNADGSTYVNNRLMKSYLNGLANLRYSKVVIRHTDIAMFKVSNLKPHPTEENMFTCTVDLEQYFEGYNGDGLLYYDKTVKRITCYVIREEVDKPDGGTDYEYQVLLGDVQSLETTKERMR